MKLYFAGPTSVTDCEHLYENGVTRCLLSYYYILKEPRLINTWRNQDLFIDSGAFSAMSLGSPIDIERYVEWIRENNIQNYANLDVIDDHRKTRRNQEYMEMKGLNPIPVVHAGAPADEVRSILSRYDYIAFGGLVPYAKQITKLKGMLNAHWKIVRDYWPKKIHGFGMTGRDIMLSYPWYSVDSTSYLSARRFGRSTDKLLCDKTQEYRRTQTHWKYRQAYEIAYFLKLEQEMTDIWKLRGISIKDDYDRRSTVR